MVIILCDEMELFRRRTVTSTAQSKNWEIELINCRKRLSRENVWAMLTEWQRPRSNSTRRRPYCLKRMNSDIRPGQSN